jgi:hypothetical protein
MGRSDPKPRQKYSRPESTKRLPPLQPKSKEPKRRPRKVENETLEYFSGAQKRMNGVEVVRIKGGKKIKPGPE